MTEKQKRFDGIFDPRHIILVSQEAPVTTVGLPDQPAPKRRIPRSSSSSSSRPAARRTTKTATIAITTATCSALIDSPQTAVPVASPPNSPKVVSVTSARNSSEMPESAPGAIVVVGQDSMHELCDIISRSGQIGATCVIALGDLGSGGDAPVTELATRSGVRLIGPRSGGFARPGLSLAVSLLASAIRGSVAFVCQEQSACTAVIAASSAHMFGLSTVASIGDAVDVSFADMVNHLARDMSTSALAIHCSSSPDFAIRGPSDARAFISAVRAYSRAKPTFVFCASLSRAGESALARSGVVRVPTEQSLLHCIMATSMQPQPRGGRLSVVTTSASMPPGVAAALAESSCSFARHSEKVQSLLSRQCSATVALDSSLVVSPEQGIARAVQLCLESDASDAVLLVLGPGVSHDAVAQITWAKRPLKPLYACSSAARMPVTASTSPCRTTLEEAKIPVFETAEDAARAFSHLRARQAALAALLDSSDPMPCLGQDISKAKAIISSAAGSSRTSLAMDEAAEVMRCFSVDGASVVAEFDRTWGMIARAGTEVALLPLRMSTAFRAAGGQASVQVALCGLSMLVCEIEEVKVAESMPPRIELFARGGRPQERLAIAPAPRDCETELRLKDGTVCRVRCAEPEDAPRVQRMLASLSEETRRLRFSGSGPEHTEQFLARLTQIDHERDLELIATVGDEVVAVMGTNSDEAKEIAEHAYLVADRWQGRGLGSALLDFSIAVARRRGLRMIWADVSIRNRVVVGMLRRRGATFTVQDDSVHCVIPISEQPQTLP